MNRVTVLKNALVALFRSGADEEHTADEMVELLEGIDFHELLQAIYSMRQSVYEYRMDGKLDKSFNYRSPELFPTQAVMLYEDAGYCCYDVAVHEHAYELWLLLDSTFVVVSRVRTEIDGGIYSTEYRTTKGTDWRDTEMFIDFVELADDLEALCAAVAEHDLPMYEL